MIEEILTLIENKEFVKLRSTLSEMNAPDIAVMFDEIPEEFIIRLFRLLPKELAAESFVEMDADTQEHLIKRFSDKELHDVLDEMFVDDTVDIIEEMPANVVKRILKHTDPQIRSEINKILNYPKDSAGSIMTIEYVDLKAHMTVAEAFDRIRKTGVDKETVYTCYVTDQNRHLIGITTVKDLLLNDYETRIGDMMETNVIYVDTAEDKEEVSNLFGKYDFLAMPVVDKETRLVGIITFDDVIDVIQEEHTEDIEKMAAILPSEKPYLKTSALEIFKNRIPWLMLLMLSSTFTQKIISSFEATLATCVALTAFIPMLMGTGGNSGGQASVTIIRGLSLGEVEMKDILKVLWKEFLVSFFCGIALAVVNFGKMMLVDQGAIIASGQNPILVALVVSLTLLATVVCAKLVGCSLPILVKRLGFDPAVTASPFVTTIVDAISLLIYFVIAMQVLHI
ncbi:MAG: magnesium transporter [Clostridia bacterium]|nr:magnesium transporter [Oscillospiraceae bacterium]MBQ7960844.1 magnesium transporter [Clostridia bacterium]